MNGSKTATTDRLTRCEPLSGGSKVKRPLYGRAAGFAYWRARRAAGFAYWRARRAAGFAYWQARRAACFAYWRARHLARPPILRLQQHRPRPLVQPPWYLEAQPPPSPPVISIVTPSFNQAKFLGWTIESVLNQNYPRLEYVVQDGGSSDGSVEVVKRYEQQLHHWESVADGGQADAINRAFRHTTGEIMGWINSDDLLLNGALNYAANYFNRHPEVDVIYGHRVLIDENNSEIGRWVLPRHHDSVMKWVDFIPQETMLWRRRIWERIGHCLDSNLQFAMDWDLLLRFREAGARFARLPRFLGAFRVHPAQKTIARAHDLGQAEVEGLRRRTHSFVPSRSKLGWKVSPYLMSHLGYHSLFRLGMLRH